MKIINVKTLEILQERHETQKYLSKELNFIVTDIFETHVSWSFRVFDSQGKKTLTFWQKVKE